MRFRDRLRLRAKLRSARSSHPDDQVKPLILMYHRIADYQPDYWGLGVSPARFEEHLRVLRRTRHPLPLAEFVRNLTVGTLPANAVALTFDDGYADNLVAGLPRLVAADIPATVFLATGYLDQPGPFWWDELANFILLERGPKHFEVVIKGQSMFFDLGTAWSPGTNADTSVALPQIRHAILEAIYQPLRRLSEEDRRATMTGLRSIFAPRDDRARLGRPMTREEVRTLAASAHVKIGAHTVSHPMLPQIEAANCQHEIITSKLACEAIVGAPVTEFAYPFGEFNNETREMVKAAGFSFACSTKRTPVNESSDVFALPRIYVPNLDGDAFEERIRIA